MSQLRLILLEKNVQKQKWGSKLNPPTLKQRSSLSLADIQTPQGTLRGLNTGSSTAGSLIFTDSRKRFPGLQIRKLALLLSPS